MGSLAECPVYQSILSAEMTRETLKLWGRWFLRCITVTGASFKP
jgi:hypothetical protein